MRSVFSIIPWLVLAVLLAGVAVSWNAGGIVADLFSSELTGAERIERVQAFFRDAGVFAPVAYVLFVVIEVIIAPIPGLMLYAPGGLIFGPWYGGALALIGNILGAGLSCSLTRTLGNRWLDRIASHKSMEKLQDALNRKGLCMILLLRLNPLTSTDLLSYAAGFTRLPVHQVMLGTGLGMAPLCFAQSWLSDGIFNAWPGLLGPLIICGLVYLIAVVVIVSRHTESR